MTYRQSLDELSGIVGGRNQNLLALVLRGLGEGIDPERIAVDIAENCGDPPLTEQEIARAITRAKEYETGNANIKWTSVSKILDRAKSARLECSDDDKAFVPNMIALGYDTAKSMTFDDIGTALSRSSPMTRNDINSFGKPSYVNMALSFIKTIWPDDSSFVFTTRDIRSPRTRERLCKPSELFNRVMSLDGDAPHGDYGLPTHCCPNLYTGESKKISGKDSYANKDVISSRRLALVEFDAMGTADQAAFWLGVVTSGSLRVRTIVYTRGKSLHGLVRVPEEDETTDIFGNVARVDKKVAERKWDNVWDELRRKLCSNDDPQFRCDSACRDASRMTRFPGGRRADNLLNHVLVYCAKPNAEDDCKAVNGKEWF